MKCYKIGKLAPILIPAPSSFRIAPTVRPDSTKFSHISSQEIERADLDKCKEDFLLRSVDSTRDVRGDDDDEGPDEHVVGATGFTEGGPMWIRQPLSPENCTVTIVGGGGKVSSPSRVTRVS